MIKRNIRNVGKRVIIQTKNFEGRKGTVTGFRGDYEKGDPFVNVFVDTTGSIWPFKGSDLRVDKNQTRKGESHGQVQR